MKNYLIKKKKNYFLKKEIYYKYFIKTKKNKKIYNFSKQKFLRRMICY